MRRWSGWAEALQEATDFSRPSQSLPVVWRQDSSAAAGERGVDRGVSGQHCAPGCDEVEAVRS
jgi:hypothetical protein